MKKKIILVLYIFLFVFTFESTILEFSAASENLSVSLDSAIPILLILTYFIPFLFILNVFIKKFNISWKLFWFTFVSGAFIAGNLSIYANELLEYLWKSILPNEIEVLWSDSLTAPFAEETLKLLVVVSALYIIPKTKGIKDFLFAGIGVGMGFQITEDMAYIVEAGIEKGPSNMALAIGLQRISGSISSHCIYTAIVATGVYILYKNAKNIRGYAYIILTVALHFLWNSPLLEGGLMAAVISAVLATSAILLFIDAVNYVAGESNIKFFKGSLY